MFGSVAVVLETAGVLFPSGLLQPTGMTNKTVHRRRFLHATAIVGATALAGCSGGEASGDDETEPSTDEAGGGERTYLDEEPDYEGWFDGANNYEGTVDWTDRDEVTVKVGYESLSFDPAAIAVSTETTVTWEWTGEGGEHNVVSVDDGPLESELSDEEGHTFTHTFEESGTFRYSCEPHEAAGMKGSVHVP